MDKRRKLELRLSLHDHDEKNEEATPNQIFHGFEQSWRKWQCVARFKFMLQFKNLQQDQH